jgi:hypothetical protein
VCPQVFLQSKCSYQIYIYPSPKFFDYQDTKRDFHQQFTRLHVNPTTYEYVTTRCKNSYSRCAHRPQVSRFRRLYRASGGSRRKKIDDLKKRLTGFVVPFLNRPVKYHPYFLGCGLRASKGTGKCGYDFKTSKVQLD